MKNLDQLIAEELENTINSEDRSTATTLERFAKALLAELVVEKRQCSGHEGARIGPCNQCAFNNAIDAFEEKKKTLLS